MDNQSKKSRDRRTRRSLFLNSDVKLNINNVKTFTQEKLSVIFFIQTKSFLGFRSGKNSN